MCGLLRACRAWGVGWQGLESLGGGAGDPRVPRLPPK